MSGDALTKNWLRLLSNKLPFLSSRESEGKIFIAVIKSSVHNGKRFLWRAASRNATMWGIIADGPKHFSNNSRHRSPLIPPLSHLKIFYFRVLSVQSSCVRNSFLARPVLRLESSKHHFRANNRGFICCWYAVIGKREREFTVVVQSFLY